MILNQIQFTNLNVIYWILLILILVTFILRKKFVKEDLRLVKTNRRKRILFVLIQEKKYFTKEELLCFSNYDQKTLDKVLNDLESSKTIITEGWLVHLQEFNEFQKEICEELLEI